MEMESKAYNTHLSYQRHKVVFPLFHPRQSKLLFWVQVSVTPDNNDSYRLQMKRQTGNVWELNNEIMSPKQSQTSAFLYLPHMNQTVHMVNLTSYFITHKTEIQTHGDGVQTQSLMLFQDKDKLSRDVLYAVLLSSLLNCAFKKNL